MQQPPMPLSPHIFEPIHALVVPSGYVHQQPLEPQTSSNQQAYGQFSNARGLNSQAMNKNNADFVAGGGIPPRTRDMRVSVSSYQNHPKIITPF